MLEVAQKRAKPPGRPSAGRQMPQAVGRDQPSAAVRQDVAQRDGTDLLDDDLRPIGRDGSERRALRSLYEAVGMDVISHFFV